MVSSYAIGRPVRVDGCARWQKVTQVRDQQANARSLDSYRVQYTLVHPV